MAKIYNSDVTKEIANNAGIATSLEKVPNELAEKVVPTFEANPMVVKPCTICRNLNTSNTIIYTVPTGKTFYLTSCSLSYTKTAASTATDSSIRITQDGVSRWVLAIRHTPATAETASLSNSFPHPLKVDGGTNITENDTGGDANCIATSTIQGFYIESSA